MGLRGRLPMFICDFFYLFVILKFVSSTHTLMFTHRRQGSILSLTLISLKINSIHSCLLSDI